MPSPAGSKATGDQLGPRVVAPTDTHCCQAPSHPCSTTGRSPRWQSYGQGRQRGDRWYVSPTHRAKRPVQRSGELEHPSTLCSDSQLEPPRDWESRGVGDRRQARGTDKASATLMGQRIGQQVARANPLKIPRQALGEAEEMQQNSAPNHSPAPSVVKPESGQAAKAAERSCCGRALGKTLHSLLKGQHTGHAG